MVSVGVGLRWRPDAFIRLPVARLQILWWRLKGGVRDLVTSLDWKSGESGQSVALAGCRLIAKTCKVVEQRGDSRDHVPAESARAWSAGLGSRESWFP